MFSTAALTSLDELLSELEAEEDEVIEDVGVELELWVVAVEATFRWRLRLEHSPLLRVFSGDEVEEAWAGNRKAEFYCAAKWNAVWCF